MGFIVGKLDLMCLLPFSGLDAVLHSTVDCSSTYCPECAVACNLGK